MSIGTHHERTEEEQTLNYNDCFDLLSNHRRRYTLHYLRQNGGQAELGELAEQVAAWENGIDIERISYDQRKRVYTSLQQVHLPQMDELGIVAFDEREGVATRTQTATRTQAATRTLPAPPQRRPRCCVTATWC